MTQPKKPSGPPPTLLEPVYAGNKEALARALVQAALGILQRRAEQSVVSSEQSRDHAA